jgi:hypothetical protein
MPTGEYTVTIKNHQKHLNRSPIDAQVGVLSLQKKILGWCVSYCTTASATLSSDVKARALRPVFNVQRRKIRMARSPGCMQDV